MFLDMAEGIRKQFFFYFDFKEIVKKVEAFQLDNGFQLDTRVKTHLATK